MCSPQAVMIMQGAGAVSQTVGAVYAANGQRAQAGLRANVLEQQAQGALEAGQMAEQRSRLATANLKGAQRAAMAANGVDLGVGTASQVLTSTDVLGEIDAQTIRADAVRSAWGYRVEASQQRAQADAIKPGAAALTTLMTGATQVADSWYRLNKGGAFDKPASAGDGMSQGDRRKLGVY